MFGCELEILRGLHLDSFDGVFFAVQQLDEEPGHSAVMLIVPCSADAASFFELEGARQPDGLARAKALEDAGSPLAEDEAQFFG